MLKTTIAALVTAIGLSAPAQASTVAPLDSFGNTADHHGAIDALWQGGDSH
jgi:hypothetical protein